MLRLAIRFVIPLFAVLGVMALVSTPLVESMLTHWFRADAESKSQVVFNALEERLRSAGPGSDDAELIAIFEAVARDERLIAVGRCDVEDVLRGHSAGWPSTVTCPRRTRDMRPSFEIVRLAGGPALLGAFPVRQGGTYQGSIVVLHDMAFVENRGVIAWWYLLGILGAFGLVAALLTLVIARLTIRSWTTSLRSNLVGQGASGSVEPDPEIADVISEVHQMMRDLDISRVTAAGLRADWSADLLRDVVASELPGADVIVASNREPYIHRHVAGGRIEVQKPASGLVTALEPIIKACGGTWIAHGSGTADRETVDRHDRVRVPPGAESGYLLRRIWLTEEEECNYYQGLSNEGLWPLCHISYVRPVFREEDWAAYVAVNERFAEAIVAEAKSDSPLVLVQDFHLALVPRLVRRRLPQATIVTFWHIPWPNAEVFGICPWREKILDGVLGSDVVGFHTQLHCNNFIESTERFIECHLDRENSTVSIGGGVSLVRPYPISIEWPPEAMRDQPPVAECRTETFERFGLLPDTRLAIGVERFDFTKGIPDRFRAVGLLLERYPEWRGKFVLLQIAAPSRSILPAYKALREEAESIATEINARYGEGAYRPIVLVAEHFEAPDVYRLLRGSEVCIVSSLHDGMNLVAKEFVAARDDERGVLILSTFAGASRELIEALIVNPFDARATAEALDRALRMGPDEQRERMQLMRATVSENNVFFWAGRLLLDAARLRKRARIKASIAAAARRKRPIVTALSERRSTVR